MVDLHFFHERFVSKVRILDNGCWEWTAYKGKYGHGVFYADGRPQQAYRWAYERVNGNLSSSKIYLDHFKYPNECIGPSCVNPEHVRPTSSRENTLRGNTLASANLSKTSCSNGHEFTSENTKYDKYGNRRCLACSRKHYDYKGSLPAALRTHCKRGHLFDEENTYVNSKGHRTCRTCRRDGMRKSYISKRKTNF